jgi:hypothetical protein
MTLRSGSLTRQFLKTLHRSSSLRRLFSLRNPGSLSAKQSRIYGREPEDKWNYNADPFNGNVGDDQNNLPFVDSNKLEKGIKPPAGVKMLVRDFIEDSLYNPNYGYFPKQATIFNTQDIAFDFPRLRDSVEFQEEVALKYAAYGADKHDGPGRQLMAYSDRALQGMEMLVRQYYHDWTRSLAMVWTRSWTLLGL